MHALIGGTVNGRGSLVMIAERVGEATMLARIVALVAAAQRSRAKVQALADRVAAVFVPIVILVAIAAFAVWALFGPEPRLSYAIVNAVAVLIIACPCALGLATPMSVTVATGRGARHGILFRNADAIQNLQRVDTVVFDKTGTLTAGKPELVGMQSLAGLTEDRVLELVAALEAASEHPLAAAIVAAAAERGLSPTPAHSFLAIEGLGIQGQVDGHAVCVGSLTLMKRIGIDVGQTEQPGGSMARSGTYRELGGDRRRIAGDAGGGRPAERFRQPRGKRATGGRAAHGRIERRQQPHRGGCSQAASASTR